MVALSFVTELSLLTLLLVAVEKGVARSLPSRLPWIHPCGMPMYPHGKPAQHKLYEQAVKSLQTQFGIADWLFKKEEENLQLVYSKIMNVFDQEYSYEWLPRKLLAWYEEEVHGIPHLPLRLEQVLPVLHSSLQNFAVAFMELKNFGVWEVNTDDLKIVRNHLIAELAIYLQQLLCEVETAMAMLKLEIPPSVSEDLVRSEDSWNSDPDHTIALIQDWGVISSYRRFIEEWVQVMSKVYTKKKPRRGH